MEGLNSKFSSLKKTIQKQKDDDVEFRQCINSIIVDIFGHTSHIKDIQRNKKNIVIIATNKISAQELFLHKEEILEGLQNNAKYKQYALTIK